MASKLSSEAKVTIGAGGAGLFALLFDVIRESKESQISDPVVIAIICCVTAIVVSYNVSRGLAKYEYRDLPPEATPPHEQG